MLSLSFLLGDGFVDLGIRVDRIDGPVSFYNKVIKRGLYEPCLLDKASQLLCICADSYM